MKQFIKILCTALLFSGIYLNNTNAFAQIPTPYCAYCGTPLPNGVHASTCRYYVAPSSASSISGSTDIKTVVTGAIVGSLLNSLFSSSPSPSQAEIEAKQKADLEAQQRAAELAAEQQRIKEQIAQAEHDKMMGSFKTLDGTQNLNIKPLGNTDLGFKTLDEPKTFQAVKSNCKITAVSGYVEIQKANTKKIQILDGQQSFVLEKGDVIKTGANGRIKLHFDFESGGKDLIVGKYSQLTLEEGSDGSQYPKLIVGKIHFSKGIVDDVLSEIQRELHHFQEYIKKFEVRTPTAILGVRGTTFTLSEDSLKGTELIVMEGSVELTGLKSGKSIIVEGGNKGNITPDGKISEPIKIEISNIEKWW